MPAFPTDVLEYSLYTFVVNKAYNEGKMDAGILAYIKMKSPVAFVKSIERPLSAFLKTDVAKEQYWEKDYSNIMKDVEKYKDMFNYMYKYAYDREPTTDEKKEYERNLIKYLLSAGMDYSDKQSYKDLFNYMEGLL